MEIQASGPRRGPDRDGRALLDEDVGLEAVQSGNAERPHRMTRRRRIGSRRPEETGYGGLQRLTVLRRALPRGTGTALFYRCSWCQKPRDVPPGLRRPLGCLHLPPAAAAIALWWQKATPTL